MSDEIAVVNQQITYALRTPVPVTVPDRAIVARDGSQVVDRSGNNVVTRA